MFVVTVEFTIGRADAAAFRAAVVGNAIASLTHEPGCRQFDVCDSDEDPGQFFLYELYDDRAAFDAHLASAHFKAFDRQVAGWVVRKTVRTYRRARPG